MYLDGCLFADFLAIHGILNPDCFIFAIQRRPNGPGVIYHALNFSAVVELSIVEASAIIIEECAVGRQACATQNRDSGTTSPFRKLNEILQTPRTNALRRTAREYGPEAMRAALKESLNGAL